MDIFETLTLLVVLSFNQARQSTLGRIWIQALQSTLENILFVLDGTIIIINVVSLPLT
jgi:hypothetical protein